MTDTEKLIMDRRPVFCKECRGKMFYQNSGEYLCEDCGFVDYDDFGKIKRFLDEKGTAMPTLTISEETGVPVEIINIYLRNGRLEIPENSRFYIKCEKCGCALRFGRFCYDCTKELAGHLQGAMFAEMGEKPKNYTEDEDKGKMRFIGDGGNKKQSKKQTRKK